MVVKKKKLERKLEREILWIVGFFAFLVVLFFVASAIFKYLSQEEYKGLVFTKTKFGELPVWHYSFYVEKTPGKLTQYNLYLRVNPSENDVPVYGEGIDLAKPQVYISINASDLSQCPDSLAAIAQLSSFLSGIGKYPEGALLNEAEAIEFNKDHITCENEGRAEVLEIFRGDESSLTIVNSRCYRLSVGADCDIVEVMEKFQLETVASAQARVAQSR